jgi:hypothetical protein
MNTINTYIMRLVRLIACSIVCYGCCKYSPSHAQSTPLQLTQLTIFMPTNIPGMGRGLGTNGILFTGWINTNLTVAITPSNTTPVNFSNVSPFVTMQKLIFAYQTADVQSVRALYDVNSRTRIDASLADADTKARWSQFVTNVRGLIPLVIWQETNKIAALTWSLKGDANTRALFPLVFDSNFNLRVDQLKSSLASQLSIYFSDGSRGPDGLVTNRQAGEIKSP